ncbi:MAG: hypothetical protein IPF44_03165 [Betaproteobacteria bacterium]|nr:hypothetical protein [Betaproteobacteria bacterium]
MKNTARWESKDGEFDGYVSCDLPAAQFKALKATSLKVVAQGKLTKLVCSYPKGMLHLPDESACAASTKSLRG